MVWKWRKALGMRLKQHPAHHSINLAKAVIPPALVHDWRHGLLSWAGEVAQGCPAPPLENAVEPKTRMRVDKLLVDR